MAASRGKAAIRRELARVRAAEALTYMRGERASLTHAAERAHTSPSTVRRRFPGTLRKERGRWVAGADRQPFEMRIASTRGVEERVTRGGNVRSLVGAHHSAVGRFLKTGRTEVLDPFVGKRAAGLTLETDPDALIELWRTGQLDFIDIYSAVP